ncbi:MAG: hypothetical protein HC785_28765 [Calothrix sp. CSU_2_0]|nr:hypothetical protein [Calothrix sp. CSU_2_0]
MARGQWAMSSYQSKIQIQIPNPQSQSPIPNPQSPIPNPLISNNFQLCGDELR